jgi:flagellar biosynthesis activator protein FlaF
MKRRPPRMPGLGLNAYKQTINTTVSGRELEASVLTKAAHLLKDCKEQWNEEGHFLRLDEALVFNQRIWTIFQGELIKEDNPLPKQLRADILNLSLFIDKRIIEVMGNPSSEKLDIIIDINLNIAAGLRGSPA